MNFSLTYLIFGCRVISEKLWRAGGKIEDSFALGK